MEIGGKGPKPPPSEHKEHGLEAIRQKMILVKNAVSNFAHDSSFEHHPKQYLPDKPVIPLGNGMDLITEQVLRADDLYLPRAPEDNPEGNLDKKRSYVLGFDLIRVPSSFIRKNSYVVLLVPSVAEENFEKGAKLVNQGMYDITVITRKDDKTALKLMGIEEGLRTHAKPIFDDSNLSSNYPLTIIPTSEEDTVIWKENMARAYWIVDPESLYKKVVNGTVCYRMIEGKAERRKSRDPKKSFVLNPATSSI